MNIRILFLNALFIINYSEFFAQTKTYCNPINLDYGYCPIPNFTTQGKHRTTADPVIINYKNSYYLFSTNQKGYWWSDDLINWNFIFRSFLNEENDTYDDLCAPGVGIVGDTMFVFGSTYTSKFTVWMSTDPKNNNWQPWIKNFEMGGWDPAFFTDDDGKLYMFNGSSNRWPLYGIELNRKTLQPIGYRKELIALDSWRFGWQRFGENMDNTFLDPFIEGAWMTKHNGKYYLQYGAPGTEFSAYADGVAISNGPLNYFDNQSDPLSYKAGGFARGAGHGASFQDMKKNYWHVSTIGICVKNNFERRIGMWPAGFDANDIMYCNTSFGDYPHYIDFQNTSYDQNGFTGWMLLNYNKPIQVSSTLGAAYSANYAVDEKIQSYWSASSGNSGEWIISDLGVPSMVHAVQINYADQDVEFLGKQINIYHQYKLYASDDGKKWKLIVDKSKNMTDIPHDYVALHKPIEAKYIKLENLHMPTGKFAISGLRVFGNSSIPKPNKVEKFIVLRTEKDKRSAWLKWKQADDAYAYQIYYGTQADKLYSCIMVYGENQYWLKTLDANKTYYFTIEAINEAGVSQKINTIKVD